MRFVWVLASFGIALVSNRLCAGAPPLRPIARRAPGGWFWAPSGIAGFLELKNLLLGEEEYQDEEGSTGSTTSSQDYANHVPVAAKCAELVEGRLAANGARGVRCDWRPERSDSTWRTRGGASLWLLCAGVGVSPCDFMAPIRTSRVGAWRFSGIARAIASAAVESRRRQRRKGRNSPGATARARRATQLAGRATGPHSASTHCRGAVGPRFPGRPLFLGDAPLIARGALKARSATPRIDSGGRPMRPPGAKSAASAGIWLGR